MPSDSHTTSQLRVFLSHASADRPTARRIKRALSRLGIYVWLDEAEIRVGESIPEAITRGMISADAFCILLSQNAERSGWVSRELNSFLSRVIAGDACIIPCKLDESPLPGLIADIKFADFRKSFESGMRDVRNAISIKEAADWNRKVDRAYSKLMDNISGDEVAWILVLCDRNDAITGGRSLFKYYISHAADDREPWELLGKLEVLDLVSHRGERYDLMYSETDLGRAVFERVYAQARRPAAEPSN